MKMCKNEGKCNSAESPVNIVAISIKCVFSIVLLHIHKCSWTLFTIRLENSFGDN